MRASCDLSRFDNVRAYRNSIADAGDGVRPAALSGVLIVSVTIAPSRDALTQSPSVLHRSR